MSWYCFPPGSWLSSVCYFTHLGWRDWYEWYGRIICQCSTWTCRFSVLDSVEYISKLKMNTCLIFLSHSFNWVVLEWNCKMLLKSEEENRCCNSPLNTVMVFSPPLKWCILSLREKCGTISQQPIHYFLLRFLPLPLSSSEARSFIAFNFSGNSTLQSLGEASSKVVTI